MEHLEPKYKPGDAFYHPTGKYSSHGIMKVSTYTYNQVVWHLENTHGVESAALFLQSRIYPRPELDHCKDVIMNTFYTEPSNKTYKMIELLEIDYGKQV